jgi:hypothetical protein
MRWNWGTGILIVIILFLGACVAFIIYSQGQKWNLVEEDYYARELRHEEKLIKMRNANALSMQLHVKIDSAGLIINFPGDFKGRLLTGNIDIYRPSDEKLDIRIPVAADTALIQRIPIHKLCRGRYILKVEWRSEGTDYYQEQDLYIP